MVVWLWQALFVLAIAAIPITNLFTLQAAMGRMRFVAMDSRDTFYLANLGSFETAQHVHAEIGRGDVGRKRDAGHIKHELHEIAFSEAFEKHPQRKMVFFA